MNDVSAGEPPDIILDGPDDMMMMDFNHVSDHHNDVDAGLHNNHDNQLTNHVAADRPNHPVRDNIDTVNLDNGIELPSESNSINNQNNPQTRQYNNSLRELLVRDVKRPGKSEYRTFQK